MQLGGETGTPINLNMINSGNRNSVLPTANTKLLGDRYISPDASRKSMISPQQLLKRHTTIK